MPELVALRQLFGSYGAVKRGQHFETDPETAQSLQSRGLVQVFHPAPAPVVSFVPAIQPGPAAHRGRK